MRKCKMNVKVRSVWNIRFLLIQSVLRLALFSVITKAQIPIFTV